MLFSTFRVLYRFGRQVIRREAGQPIPPVKIDQEEQSEDQPEQPNMIRLSKLLTTNSVCSRREAQKLLSLGLVRINGQRQYGNSLVPVGSQVKLFSNNGIRQQKPVTKLWMMNKPRGYVCSERDPENRPTIYSLLPAMLPQTFGHIMSVGRLDYNSEGLLLLTNDNTLKAILESPETKLPRVYRVKVHGRVTQQKLEMMKKPMLIAGREYGPLKVQVGRTLATNMWLDVELMTGKNRQIRKIMQKCDLQVNKLIRTHYGNYKLGSLKHRQVRQVGLFNNIQRKLEKIERQNLKNDPKMIVEVDARTRAIQYAEQERKNIGQSDKPTLPQ